MSAAMTNSERKGQQSQLSAPKSKERKRQQSATRNTRSTDKKRVSEENKHKFKRNNFLVEQANNDEEVPYILQR
jgi:hypothetical protein